MFTFIISLSFFNKSVAYANIPNGVLNHEGTLEFQPNDVLYGSFTRDGTACSSDAIYEVVFLGIDGKAFATDRDVRALTTLFTKGIEIKTRWSYKIKAT